MIQRRAAGLDRKGRIGCHMFRTTGNITCLEAGCTLEKGSSYGGVSSSCTTNDRTGDEITLDQAERIAV